SDGKRPRLLFLGDSFTYGLFVPSEETIPQQTAKLLGGQAINAGVPGYSLAQVLIYAEKLIPKYKPDYVIVQYTPWMVERSTSGFATFSQGLLAAPYLFDTDTGMAIHPPA